MKIDLRPTGRFEYVNGVRCRMWEGSTDKGIELAAFIPLIAVRRELDNEEFQRELNEVETVHQPVVFEHRMVV